MVVNESALRGNNEAKLTPRSLQMRMDRAIRQSVVTTLEDAGLPDGTVWISVKTGWVTIRGQVDWDSQRIAATMLIRDLVGVRGVTNTLAVAQDSHGPRP
jgi:osmotically-inducible protein OsmY